MTNSDVAHAETHAAQARAIGDGLMALLARHGNLKDVVLLAVLQCGFRITINLSGEKDAAATARLLRDAADVMESEPLLGRGAAAPKETLQ